MEDILKETDNKYDMYLVNHGTIQSYAKKHGWENLNRFLNNEELFNIIDFDTGYKK